MSSFVPPLRRSLRALLSAVVVGLAIPIALAAGAALPTATIVIGTLLGTLVGVVARTGMWLVGEPDADRANGLAVTAGLGAGSATLALDVFALLAGPVALVVVPLLTAAGVAVWWIGDHPRSCA